MRQFNLFQFCEFFVFVQKNALCQGGYLPEVFNSRIMTTFCEFCKHHVWKCVETFKVNTGSQHVISGCINCSSVDFSQIMNSAGPHYEPHCWELCVVLLV